MEWAFRLGAFAVAVLNTLAAQAVLAKASSAGAVWHYSPRVVREIVAATVHICVSV